MTPIRYLYKYLDRHEYAAAMIEHGTVRFGTSSEYRKMELEDGARGDRYEGAVRIDYRTDDSGMIPDVHREFLAQNRIGMFAAVNCSVIDYTSIGPDFYMYCTSCEYSKKVADLFSAVACVRISKPYFVVEKMFVALHKRGLIAAPKYLSAKVEYYDIPIDIDRYRDYPACVLKTRRFADQHEYRFGFFATAQNPEGQVIDVPEIRSFCRIVDMPV